MTIKKRFILTLCVSIALLVTGAVLTSVAIWQSRGAMDESIAMDALVAQLYQLHILSLEFEASPSERAARQWMVMYGKVGKRVAEARGIPGEVVDAFANMGVIFAKLQTLKIKKTSDSALLARSRNQLFGSLHIESQHMIDWALDLSADSRTDFVSLVRSFSLGLLLLSIMVAFIAVGVFFITGRYMLRAITTLKNGTERIARGELAHRIELSGTDEMADLADAFNRMTRDLQEYWSEVAQSNFLLRAIDEINHLVARGGEESILFRDMCQSLIMETPYRFCWIGVREDGAESAVRPVAWSGYENGYLEKAGYGGAGNSIEATDPVLAAIQGKLPVFVPRVMNLSDPARWCAEARAMQYAAIAVLPIAGGDGVFGCFMVCEGDKDDFSKTERSLLIEMAQTISNGIQSLRDQATRKQAEEERNKLEEQLRQAQKMEAVGQLAGGIAHDFNNLLQVILANTDLAQEELRPGTPAWEELNEVLKAGGRAAELTSQLLAFSRRQVIQPINLDLNHLLEGVLRMLRRLIGEHIEIRFLPGAGPATANVDKGQTEQVFMNLCVNARDAMARGGALTIETENTTLDREFCRTHPWAAPGRYVVVSVMDTGHGMDTATCARIFEPFFTTKGLGQGTGLGLATVYGIVKQHKGLIHVYSELGAGTVFRVYFPAVASMAEAPAAAEKQAIVGGAETLLVAEDDPSVLKLLVAILCTAGYTVLSAADGNEALQLFEQHAAGIDAVVLDVMMPGLSGKQVMERIKDGGAKVPFLFCSGYSESVIHKDFAAGEGIRLIQKPYSREGLLQEVRRILDDRRAGL